MPLGWMTALKLVPWSDVIEATPKIVKSARSLFTSTTSKKPTVHSAAAGEGIDVTVVALANNPTALASLAHGLQARIGALEEEQHASAELIRSLAEQNAEIVRVVDGARRRLRLLSSVCLVLVVAVVLLVIRVAQLA